MLEFICTINKITSKSKNVIFSNNDGLEFHLYPIHKISFNRFFFANYNVICYNQYLDIFSYLLSDCYIQIKSLKLANNLCF